MRRRDFLRLVVSATAQQQGKTRRIGYLDYGAGIFPSGAFGFDIAPMLLAHADEVIE